MRSKLFRLVTVLVAVNCYQIGVSAEPITLVCNGETTFSVPALGPVTPQRDPFTVTVDFDRKQVSAPILFPTCGSDFEQFDQCRCDIKSISISCEGASRSKRNPAILWRFNFSLNRHTGIFFGENLNSITGDDKNYQHTEIWKYKCEVAKRKF